MNMNVLDGGLVPKVMNIKEVLRAWLNHRQEVLVRRSQYRLDAALHRLEVLAGHLIAYLNLEEVIRIIREEDEPKQELMKAFDLTDVQAEAILNIRLRSLRKLEEMEIKREHSDLTKERDALQALLKSEAKQWKEIGKQVAHIKELFGPNTALGARRTKIGKAPSLVAIEQIEDALTEKEPITVICSAKVWIKAMKGHEHNPNDFTYKDGDRARFVIEAMTNDKLIAFGMVHRLESLNAFVDCRHPGCESHETAAFAICESCGQVAELEDPDLVERVTALARRTHFAVKKTTIELRGRCAACQAG